MGHDFSHVRVHTDGKAAESAQKMNALAYTVGRDVVFDTGRYAPAYHIGRQLLAHELAHVVQQGTTPTFQGKLTVSTPDDISEHEADAAAKGVANGKPAMPFGSGNLTHLASLQLQRACAVPFEQLNDCNTGDSISALDRPGTSETLFLFNEECELLPGYQTALTEFAAHLPTDATIQIHGFSSAEEFADFSCQRALVVRTLLLGAGVDSEQIDSMFYHSAVPGPLEVNRSVLIERVGSRPVHQTPQSPQAQAGQRGTRKEEQPAVAPQLMADEATLEYTEAGWSAVNRLGIVRVEESEASMRGARLRRGASDTSEVIHHLDENTRVLVIAENKAKPWIYVQVDNKQYKGSLGYVFSPLIWRGLPDPDAVLYYVAEPGLGLQKLVENHEQYKGYDLRTGDDARSIVMAVLVANDEDSRTKGNVRLNQEKLAKAEDPGVWESIKDEADEYRRVLRPILQAVELLQGKKIWLPGETYIQALKGKGVIPTRPEWKNVAISAGKAIGGFVSGLIEGFITSILDVFVGIYEMIKSVISLVKDLISGEAIRAAQELYDEIDRMSAEEIFNLLKDALAQMIGSALKEFSDKWNANNTYNKWNFRGRVVGYILAEILMLIFTGGSATAAKWLGKLGKVGQKLEKALSKILKKVDDVLDKVPGRKRSRRDTDDISDTGSKQARELPAALVLAGSIAETHDVNDSPVTAVLASLAPLRRKYRWIKGFTARRTSPGHRRIILHASEHTVDPDYTPKVDPDIDEIVEQAFAEGKVRSGELIELQPHGSASKARKAKGVTGKQEESAHGAPRSAMRNVKSYDPDTALTRLIPKGTHRQMDSYWKEQARMLVKNGRKDWTAQEMFDAVSESIRRTPGLSDDEKFSLIQRLSDEVFVEYGLKPTDLVRLPYS